MKIDPNAPAFPTSDTIYPNGEVQYGFNGLTIRAEIASRIMAGFAANSASANVSSKQLSEYAPRNAVAMADILIAELNK